MKGFTRRQRETLSEFLTTIAAAWFAGGVVSTVFVRSGNLSDAAVNVAIGLILAFASLYLALSFKR